MVSKSVAPTHCLRDWRVTPCRALPWPVPPLGLQCPCVCLWEILAHQPPCSGLTRPQMGPHTFFQVGASFATSRGSGHRTVLRLSFPFGLVSWRPDFCLVAPPGWPLTRLRPICAYGALMSLLRMVCWVGDDPPCVGCRPFSRRPPHSALRFHL